MGREAIARVVIHLECDEEDGPTFVTSTPLLAGDTMEDVLERATRFFLKSIADPTRTVREFAADVRENDGVPRWRREQALEPASSSS